MLLRSHTFSLQVSNSSWKRHTPGYGAGSPPLGTNQRRHCFRPSVLPRSPGLSQTLNTLSLDAVPRVLAIGKADTKGRVSSPVTSSEGQGEQKPAGHSLLPGDKPSSSAGQEGAASPLQGHQSQRLKEFGAKQ